MEDFMRSVEDGVKLSKRIYYGKDRSIAPPKPPPPMSKSPSTYVPTAPMVYAVIHDPSIVDNPDIPSYQPHVCGRCDPPALISLQMNGVELEVECGFEDVEVRVRGSWRVHCVMASKGCDCRLVVPMGEQYVVDVLARKGCDSRVVVSLGDRLWLYSSCVLGWVTWGSILGVEVEVARKLYSTRLVSVKEEEVGTASEGGYLKPGLFMLTIPNVDGGTNLSIKFHWSQKLSYYNGEFIISVPFIFPEFVVPAGKKIPKREKILLSINAGEGSEVVCKTTSHPLKERRRQAGKLSFLYEAEVLKWSSMDFRFSYSVFARQIIYVVDTSTSMSEKPPEDVKNALSTTLAELNPEDLFSIIAFNGDISILSSSLKHANKDVIEDATQWIRGNFVPGDGTSILLALNQALEMLSDSSDSISMIFLITDGAVEDERHICRTAEKHLSDRGSMGPRIHTFGIGHFCNHYFLRKLSIIGQGLYGAAYDSDSIEPELSKLINRASSTVFPTHIPDLSSEGALVICGRYRGNMPEVLELKGIAADMKSVTVELKVQKSKDTSLQRMVTMQQISTWTAQAWFSEEKQLEEKVARMSVVAGLASEYTAMILVESESTGHNGGPGGKEKKLSSNRDSRKGGAKTQTKLLLNLGIGFGDLKATAENLPPGTEEAKPPEAAEIIRKAASNCCGKLFGYCCCMCCIELCSKINNQCAIVLTQACTAFACFGFLECCVELCCSGNDGN
ncbi:Inter-alpha-trypsin inhibitor heavy chain H2-like protein [Drosera capensis]